MKSRFFFSPFLFASVLFHFCLFAILRENSGSFSLLPVKGVSPLEISELSKVSAPTKSTTEKGFEPEASGKPAPVAAVNAGTGGISDGSEIGILKPIYPESSRLRGEEGKVLLLLKLGKGLHDLQSVEILESSGFSGLDRAALQAVKTSLRKAVEGGETVEKKIQFVFRLNAGNR